MNKIQQPEVDELINWINDYVFSKAKSRGVVLGMSGGKDSLICAKLCVEALGSENVFGVIMPNGEQKDISDAIKTCELLGIDYEIVNIEEMFKGVMRATKSIAEKQGTKLGEVSVLNTPPRLRMTTLYSVAASLGCLVVNTSNLSEKTIGYSTKWGDNVGDFAPLVNFTKTEVCQIGDLLGLPDELVNKKPADGLTGKTDEDKLGFKYEELDYLIRDGKLCPNTDKILRMIKSSQHKRVIDLPSFDSGRSVKIEDVIKKTNGRPI